MAVSDDKRTIIETALALDVDTLSDEEYLEQQSRVETHYERAAELYFRGDTGLAEQHEEAAYESAKYLRDMVVHDLNMGSKWGRVKRRLE